MSEKTIKTVAVVVAAAAALWALAHFFEEKRSEKEDRSPGATNIGPETTLAWPSKQNDSRAVVRNMYEASKRLQTLGIVGNVP